MCLCFLELLKEASSDDRRAPAAEHPSPAPFLGHFPTGSQEQAVPLPQALGQNRPAALLSGRDLEEKGEGPASPLAPPPPPTNDSVGRSGLKTCTQHPPHPSHLSLGLPVSVSTQTAEWPGKEDLTGCLLGVGLGEPLGGPSLCGSGTSAHMGGSCLSFSNEMICFVFHATRMK